MNFSRVPGIIAIVFGLLMVLINEDRKKSFLIRWVGIFIITEGVFAILK